MAGRAVLEKAQPFVVGFLSGVVAATIVGLASGWVVTASAREQAIWAAKVNRLAAICAAQAGAQWHAQGRELAELRGWEGREARQRLVEPFTVALRLEGALQGDVGVECGRMLDP